MEEFAKFFTKKSPEFEEFSKMGGNTQIHTDWIKDFKKEPLEYNHFESEE